MSMIQDLAAAEHVRLCKSLSAMGMGPVQLNLIHLPGNAAETTNLLWMIPLGGRDRKIDQKRIRSEIILGLYEFAIQPGFDGDLFIGDIIQDETDLYVTDYDNDQTGAIFKVNCTSKKGRVLGAV